MGSAADQMLAALNNWGIQTSRSITSGNIWFVDSGAAQRSDTNDGEHGKSWDMPFATLDFAVGCASVDDVIYVAEGHAETLATAGALDLDVQGLKVIGLGQGTRKPKFTIGATSVAAADIDIDAADILLENCQFTIAAVDVTAMIDMNAKNFTCRNCDFTMNVTSYEAVTAIDINGGGANACDRAVIDGCTFWATVAAGSAQAIELGEVADGVLIKNCRVFGDFSNAAIHNPTGKVLTRLTIADCWLQNTQTGDHSLELVSACTGFAIRNFYHGDTDAALVDPGSLFSYECYGNDTVDKNGMLVPAAVTAT